MNEYVGIKIKLKIELRIQEPTNLGKEYWINNTNTIGNLLKAHN